MKILTISKFPAIQNKSLSWFFLNIKGGLHRNILNKQLEGERCDPNVPPTEEENEIYFSLTPYANKRIYDWVKSFYRRKCSVAILLCYYSFTLRWFLGFCAQRKLKKVKKTAGKLQWWYDQKSLHLHLKLPRRTEKKTQKKGGISQSMGV